MADIGIGEAMLISAALSAATAVTVAETTPKPTAPKAPVTPPPTPQGGIDSVLSQQKAAEQQAETAGGTMKSPAERDVIGGGGSNPGTQPKKGLLGQ